MAPSQGHTEVTVPLLIVCAAVMHVTNHYTAHTVEPGLVTGVTVNDLSLTLTLNVHFPATDLELQVETKPWCIQRVAYSDDKLCLRDTAEHLLANPTTDFLVYRSGKVQWVRASSDIASQVARILYYKALGIAIGCVLWSIVVR